MTPFFMAWGMFFVLPCPVRKWDENKFREMLLCLPLIGVLIGLLWTGIVFLTGEFIPIGRYGLLTPAIVFLTPWVLSGFTHIDGFMDCSDAVLSRRNIEERRRILKDSHVGAFAVIMLVILAVLSFAVCTGVSFYGREWLLLLIPVVSRSGSSFCVLVLRPFGGTYKDIHENGVPAFYPLCCAAVCAAVLVCGFAFFGISAFCLVSEIIIYALTVLILRRNLGGMSGDIAGCALTVSEFAALLTLLFL